MKKILIFITLLSSLNMIAQTIKPYKPWIGFGSTFLYLYDNEDIMNHLVGFNASLGITLQNSEFIKLNSGNSTSLLKKTKNEESTIHEINILYGKYFPIEKKIISFCAGLGYTSGFLKGDSKYIGVSGNGGMGINIGAWGGSTVYLERKKFETFNLPIEISIIDSNSKKEGVCTLGIHANINDTYFYIATFVTVQFGKIRFQ